MQLLLRPESLLTKDDDLDNLGCNPDGILHLECIVSRVIDRSFTDHKVAMFAIAGYFDTIQAVFQFDTTKVPRADGLWFGHYGNVEVNGFSTVHMDSLLRDVGHVDLGHHWDTKEGQIE